MPDQNEGFTRPVGDVAQPSRTGTEDHEAVNTDSRNDQAPVDPAGSGSSASAEKDQPWIDTEWTIARSIESPSVWVPITTDGDSSCFLHAGTLRQAKAYMEREWQRYSAVDDQLRWRKVDADHYALEVRND